MLQNWRHSCDFKLRILTLIVLECNILMQGKLQLTLAIIKPHVTKVPHALQVGFHSDVKV